MAARHAAAAANVTPGAGSINRTGITPRRAEALSAPVVDDRRRPVRDAGGIIIDHRRR